MRATTVAIFIGTLFLYPLLAPLLAPLLHRINDAHFQRITEGMTEAEVEAIFGVPTASEICVSQHGMRPCACRPPEPAHTSRATKIADSPALKMRMS